MRRAKERHGLKALLLGEIDPADIENRRRGANQRQDGKLEESDVTLARRAG